MQADIIRLLRFKLSLIAPTFLRRKSTMPENMNDRDATKRNEEREGNFRLSFV